MTIPCFPFLPVSSKGKVNLHAPDLHVRSQAKSKARLRPYPLHKWRQTRQHEPIAPSNSGRLGGGWGYWLFFFFEGGDKRREAALASDITCAHMTRLPGRDRAHHADGECFQPSMSTLCKPVAKGQKEGYKKRLTNVSFKLRQQMRFGLWQSLQRRGRGGAGASLRPLAVFASVSRACGSSSRPGLDSYHPD